MAPLYFLSPKTMFTVLNQVSGKSFKCGDEESVLDGALSNGLIFHTAVKMVFVVNAKPLS